MPYFPTLGAKNVVVVVGKHSFLGMETAVRAAQSPRDVLASVWAFQMTSNTPGILLPC